MKPKVIIEVPENFSDANMGKLQGEILSKHSNIEFEVIANQSINFPQAKSIDRRGADMGNFDGDAGYPAIAAISGIQSDLNNQFRMLS